MGCNKIGVKKLVEGVSYIMK